MTFETKQSNPLKWHGGKSYLAKQIIDLFPPHTHYVEPYFGGGAVLFAKPVEWIEGHSEVVNDIYRELTNFWRVLQQTPDRMLRALWATPFSAEEFDAACQIKADEENVRRATAFFIRYRQSRQGLGKDFATLSRNRTRRGMNEQASAWLSAIEGLPEAHERLKRVVILNDDACKVIKQQDGPETFFYCDPPYLHDTRRTTSDYEYEMAPEQHEELLKTLGQIGGKFLLSGYPSEMYQGAAELYGWRCTEIEIDNKASGKKTKDKKTECLWRNY